MAFGLALIVPAAWIEFSSRNTPAWLSGLALVAGATGAALLWTGMTGSQPDWVDEDRSPHDDRS